MRNLRYKRIYFGLAIAVVIASATSFVAMTHAQDIPGIDNTTGLPTQEDTSPTPEPNSAPINTTAPTEDTGPTPEPNSAPISNSSVAPTPGTAQTGTNSNTNVNTQYTLLAPLPCSAGLGATCTGKDTNGEQALTTISLAQFISYAYKFMLALAVVLAVLMITIGGFEYMLSGATGTKTDAIKKIQDACWGLVLALVAYLLLYTIDPNLVSPSNLTIPPITYSAAFTQTNGATTDLETQLNTDSNSSLTQSRLLQTQIDALSADPFLNASEIQTLQGQKTVVDQTGNYQAIDANAISLIKANPNDPNIANDVQLLQNQSKAIQQLKASGDTQDATTLQQESFFYTGIIDDTQDTYKTVSQDITSDDTANMQSLLTSQQGDLTQLQNNTTMNPTLKNEKIQADTTNIAKLQDGIAAVNTVQNSAGSAYISGQQF